MPKVRGGLIAVIALGWGQAAIAGSAAVSVTVPQAAPNGEAWDVLDGPPDILFCIAPEGSDVCFAEGHYTCGSDAFTCSIGVTVPDGEPFRLYFFDADVVQRDRIGTATCQADGTCTFEGLEALQVDVQAPPVEPFVDLALALLGTRTSSPGARATYGAGLRIAYLGATAPSGLAGVATVQALADPLHGYDLSAGFGPATVSTSGLLGVAVGIGADRMKYRDAGVRKAMYGFVGGQLAAVRSDVVLSVSASYHVRSAASASEEIRVGAWVGSDAIGLRLGGEGHVYRADLLRGSPVATDWLVGISGPLL